MKDSNEFTKSYNGRIAMIHATVESHEKRLTNLEKSYKYDHDKLIELISEVENIGEKLTDHLKYHERLANKALDLKFGFILVMVQVLFNAIVFYVVTKMG